MKMPDFIHVQIKPTFKLMAMHQASLSWRGLRQPGNWLLWDQKSPIALVVIPGFKNKEIRVNIACSQTGKDEFVNYGISNY